MRSRSVSRWRRCSRRVFINRLHKLGFIGPYAGTRHQFVVFQNYRLAVPSNKEFSVSQLKTMLHEIEGILGRRLSLDEWEHLG
jgi:hypothetical protein